MRSPLVIMLLVLALAGSLSAQDADFYVFASHSILGDVVARVAGEVLDVRTLMPPGADPHAFQLRARAVGELLEADLLFINGARYEEGVLGQVLDTEASLPTVVVSDCVALWHEAHDEVNERNERDEHDVDDESVQGRAVEACHELRAALGLPAVSSDALLIANNCDGDEHEDEEEGADEQAHACDPHVWLDPHNVMLWTAQIRDSMSEHLPARADEFAANADVYLAELRDLDANLSEQLQTIPQPRLLVTQHDSMGYFAARFGFETESVLRNFSSLSEANPAELAELLDRLHDRGVLAIFGEEPLESRVLEQIAIELRVPLESIYGDGLSAVGGPAASYIEYMRENVRRITDALSGSGG